jgi:hypothetical protein
VPPEWDRENPSSHLKVHAHDWDPIRANPTAIRETSCKGFPVILTLNRYRLEMTAGIILGLDADIAAPVVPDRLAMISLLFTQDAAEAPPNTFAFLCANSRNVVGFTLNNWWVERSTCDSSPPFSRSLICSSRASAIAGGIP